MDKENACDQFVRNGIRKICKTCGKPKEDHPLSEEDADSIKKFMDYPETKSHVQYAWTPPYCPEKRLDEYFQKFPDDKIPRRKSEGQKDRLRRLVFQNPLTDLSVDNCQYLDEKFRDEMENYVNALKNSILRVGIVKEWSQGMAMQCPKCLLVLEPGELLVASSENGGQAFHPACFACFKCGDLLADLIHCSDVDGAAFCLRHYSDNTKKRCHTCDELIFTSQFALAGEKYYHKDHLLCFGCNEPLKGSKGYSKEGELYCAGCYEEQFCSYCSKCLKKITLESRHVSYHDKSWHYDCFTCGKCDTLLPDTQFEVVEGDEGDVFLCSECYNKEYAPRCNGCNDIFEPQASVVKYEEKLFHVPCFKCMDCEDTIGTGPFVPHKGRVYCKTCHLRNFGVKCFRCKYSITDDRGIMYNKKPYHEDCFICHACSTKIASRPFKTVDDNWFCMNCYADKFCKKCHSCDKPILLGVDQDVMYSYEDLQWHASCFVCSLCKNSLADKPFLKRDKVLVCKECVAENSKEPAEEETSEPPKSEEHESPEVAN